MAQTATESILALDVGTKRIGVALASLVAKLPSPHSAIQAGQESLDLVIELAKTHNAKAIVVGLPLGLDGQETKQTAKTLKFVDELKKKIDMPVYTQAETLTSKKAEVELEQRKLRYNKGAVDALAATYILEDFLREHPKLP